MTVDGDTIRAVMHWTTEYWLWSVAALGATLSFYQFLKKDYPRTARAVGAPFKAFGAVIAAPFRFVRWNWRNYWRDKGGGPIARRKMRHHADIARTVHQVIKEVVDPQFDITRKAALAQHEDQNIRIDAVAGQVAGLSERMAGIEEMVTQPARRKAGGG